MAACHFVDVVFSTTRSGGFGVPSVPKIEAARRKEEWRLMLFSLANKNGVVACPQNGLTRWRDDFSVLRMSMAFRTVALPKTWA